MTRHVATYAALVLLSCWSGPRNDYVIDGDHVRKYFYVVRALCPWADDVAAFASPIETTARFDGDNVLYNEAWLKGEMRRCGDDAAIVIFAHELRHALPCHPICTFSTEKDDELESDSFAGCISAKLDVTRETGVCLMAKWKGDIAHYPGPLRAGAFMSGWDKCHDEGSTGKASEGLR